MSLSVLLPSGGERASFMEALASVATQLVPGDELIVDVNNDAPWGHKARNRMMKQAKGEWLMFIDDDDTYLPGALETVRNLLQRKPERVHMFRMEFATGHPPIWTDPEVRLGNVSTQMFVVPNLPDQLGKWGDRYEGDFDFIRETCLYMGQPIWHTAVIARYGRTASARRNDG